MVTTYLQGGLGNYMFQIAAAHTLSLDVSGTTLFNESKATRIHRPLSFYKDNIFRKINFTNEDVEPPTYQEGGFEYAELPLSDNVLLSGYFIKYIKDKYGDLNNTCSIHVRRGDYVVQPGHHPVCSPQYYQQSVMRMPEGTKFLIFSDDIPFCKEVFKGDSFIFIENELDYMDMYIMSMCTNNIIANSTFSWWGAWLNNNENKVVIAPSVWFGVAKQLNTKDIIPNEWIKI
jgi:hypothetical protein